MLIMQSSDGGRALSSDN